MVPSDRQNISVYVVSRLRHSGQQEAVEDAQKVMDISPRISIALSSLYSHLVEMGPLLEDLGHASKDLTTTTHPEHTDMFFEPLDRFLYLVKTAADDATAIQTNMNKWFDRQEEASRKWDFLHDVLPLVREQRGRCGMLLMAMTQAFSGLHTKVVEMRANTILDVQSVSNVFANQPEILIKIRSILLDTQSIILSISNTRKYEDALMNL